ncbi:hypothetical protein GCM10022243_64890 [Saccharothrix violaceirubra]|uniref:Uncharacterized protein n=1 Tax=Saccharothrix violaceirubra TaxID=413306 RepID=A0A7W7T9H2_9PSEU|nr:hypothetical protein [Saccharothrix violaceirubra]MBB4969024.1 hypothetical protein [Saccharothrix violaceirubra]
MSVPVTPSATTEDSAESRKLRVDVALAEYNALKAEQSKRIGHRDRTVYSTLAAGAGVVAAAASSGHAVLLLALPVVSLLLGWVYHVNDELIGAAGRYLREHTGPRLAALLGDVPALGWETAHRSDARRRLRKIGQMVMDLTAFVVMPTAALITWWTTGPCPAGLVVVSIVETLLLGWLAVMTVLAADLTTSAQRSV